MTAEDFKKKLLYGDFTDRTNLFDLLIDFIKTYQVEIFEAMKKDQTKSEKNLLFLNGKICAFETLISQVQTLKTQYQKEKMAKG